MHRKVKTLTTPRGNLPQSPEGNVPAKARARNRSRNRRNDKKPDRVLPGNPEGDLIETARYELGISQNEAARRAGMKIGVQYRAAVRKQKSNGTPTNPRPETWARLALVMGVSAEAFEDIGRPDVAKVITIKRRAVTPIDDGPMSVLDQLVAIRDLFGPELFWAAVDVLIKRLHDNDGDPGKVVM